MYRFIDQHLKKWAEAPRRQPILLKGARQVGKTFAVRTLGENFENLVEINFEKKPDLRKIFDENLDPVRIIRDLKAYLQVNIVPGKTLLFFDEVQEAPLGITALRYFYEEMPGLHVIAAGSLLDFAIQEVGVPVGRVAFLHLYPMSWMEFLKAQGNDLLFDKIMAHQPDVPMSDFIHEKLLNMLCEYFVIGGMPQAVADWVANKDPLSCFAIHENIINAYRQDFSKYAKEYQVKYVQHLFDSAPVQLGQKFKYSAISGDFRKRELEPALDLLGTARIAHKIMHSSGQGLPLGAQVRSELFKIIFLDIGLTQAILGMDLADWFVHSKQSFINKGEIIEAFVGQELLAYSNPARDNRLYYWQREAKASQAELDYLIQFEGQVVPVEVKAGKGSHLKSMRLFLESHPNSSFGIRFSTNNYSIHEKIHSYPLYAIAAALKREDKF
ncbi:MAG: ATP-binding protein [Gammaproteobacteria bacterium]